MEPAPVIVIVLLEELPLPVDVVETGALFPPHAVRSSAVAANTPVSQLRAGNFIDLDSSSILRPSPLFCNLGVPRTYQAIPIDITPQEPGNSPPLAANANTLSNDEQVKVLLPLGQQRAWTPQLLERPRGWGVRYSSIAPQRASKTNASTGTTSVMPTRK